MYRFKQTAYTSYGNFVEGQSYMLASYGVPKETVKSWLSQDPPLIEAINKEEVPEPTK